MYFGDQLEPSLLCPNQLRANGIVVVDVPKHLAPDYYSTHSVYVPELDLRLPLQTSGVVSYLPTRYPTELELESCTYVYLTSAETWDLNAAHFWEQE